MDRDIAADRLRHLASDSAKRTKAARPRDVFQQIEGALEAGVSQTIILDELRAMGLDVNPDTFRSTLRRLRQRQPAPSTEMPAQFASTRAPFADTGRGLASATTFRGALYDAEALSRLLLASAHRPREDALLG
jgi:hypothetical protein